MSVSLDFIQILNVSHTAVRVQQPERTERWPGDGGCSPATPDLHVRAYRRALLGLITLVLLV